MIDLFGVHAFNEANVVGDLARVLHEVADPGPAFAVLLVGFDGSEKLSLVSRGGHRAEALAFHVTGGNRLSVALFELRLVVEELEVGRAAILEEKDDAFGFRRDLLEGGRELARFRGL